MILARLWEAPGVPKINKKSKKNAYGVHLGFLIDFGSDFGAILVDLGWILDGFWKDFEKILEGFWEDFANND